MSDEKYTPIDSFVHFSAPRNATGIQYRQLSKEKPVSRTQMAQDQRKRFDSRNTSEKQRRQEDFKAILVDLGRDGCITDDPNTAVIKIHAFLLALSRNAAYKPPGYSQGDFTAVIDLLLLQQERTFQGDFAEQRCGGCSYFKLDPAGKETSLAGVSIVYYPAVRVGKTDLPALLAISVVNYPEDGMLFDDANVDFFFDAKTAGRFDISEDAKPAVTPKTEMDRQNMLENLKKVIGNDKVFALIENLVRNPRQIEAKVFLDQRTKIEMSPEQKAELDEAHGQFEEEASQKLVAQKASQTEPPLVPPIKKRRNIPKWVAWAIGTLMGLSFIASFPLTYFYANDYGIFAGFASTALGMASGLSVGGLAYGLFRLHQWGKEKGLEPSHFLAIFVSVVGVGLTFELTGQVFSHPIMEGIHGILDIISPAGGYGSAAFCAAAVLTLGVMAYGYCKHRQVSGAENQGQQANVDDCSPLPVPGGGSYGSAKVGQQLDLPSKDQTPSKPSKQEDPALLAQVLLQQPASQDPALQLGGPPVAESAVPR